MAKKSAVPQVGTTPVSPLKAKTHPTEPTIEIKKAASEQVKNVLLS